MKEEGGENITKTRRSRESSNDCGAANGVGVVAATVMANNNNNNNNHNNNSNKGNYNYKFWVLAAIIVLALWSMFTGSVTLKWSASNLTRFSHDLDHSITLQDLDVLEVEEREKVVRRMWEVYTHSTTTKVPRFWSDAFHAAYEHLVSDVPSTRDAAISEIAKMSIQFLSLQQQLPIQLQSESNIRVSRKMKQEQESSWGG
ncbi:homeobox protein 10 isoform X1 [Arachis ipaensis]|uniref:homeobox protein 10 isoform X1 n=1 Tax=Arachis ipaensis TaxID=130454 RepID=UPI0007AF978B|nr:homeobox protein 10 isoform X1 [Arachis ipaensis]